jgi:hypothetical protein
LLVLALLAVETNIVHDSEHAAEPHIRVAIDQISLTGYARAG